MSIAVLASGDPGLAISQAGDLLAGDPVGHNVVGTKLADAIRYGEPGRYWVGLLDGVPAGVAVLQPVDTTLAVAPMPATLIAAIAYAVDADGVALPGVFGPGRDRVPLRRAVGWTAEGRRDTDVGGAALRGPGTAVPDRRGRQAVPGRLGRPGAVAFLAAGVRDRRQLGRFQSGGSLRHPSTNSRRRLDLG